MSLKPGFYGHADDYRASAGELLASARTQIADWNAGRAGETCPAGHRMRAMDKDGCNVFTRAQRAERLASGADPSPLRPSAVIEFCLDCGAVEWLDDRLRVETEDAAIARVAPWTIGRAYQLTYKRQDDHEPRSGEFIYRGLTDAAGTHQFEPSGDGPRICLHKEEIISAS